MYFSCDFALYSSYSIYLDILPVKKKGGGGGGGGGLLNRKILVSTHEKSYFSMVPKLLKN